MTGRTIGYQQRQIVHLIHKLTLFAFLGATTAQAATDPGCSALSGDDSSGECVISGTSPVPLNSTITVGENVRILHSGIIAIPAGGTFNLDVQGDLKMETGPLTSASILGNGNGANRRGATINIVTSGQIVLHGDGSSKGAKITADQTGGSCAGGHGGSIKLKSNLANTSVGPSVQVQGGALISVNGNTCPAGDITIEGTGQVEIDGTVEAAVDNGLTGSGSRTDGGTITIKAACSLLVSSGGKVSSRGHDNGADLVQLIGGCKVEILGLVESTGTLSGGHAAPTNHCNDDNVVAHPLIPNQGQYNACVQVVSGGTLLIDGPSGGEVHTDGIQAPNRSWIDLFAVGDITIDGSSAFAVHANGAATTNTRGGLITVKSQDGKVTANDLAIQADATSGGSRGGHIRIEAGGALALGTAQISAQGDSNATGGFGFGGLITTRSYSGQQIWTNGVANVQPTGTDVGVLNNGKVTFQVCLTGTEDHSGTSFPVTSGVTTNPIIDSSVGACGGHPTIPFSLPACSDTCGGGGTSPPGGFCQKSSVKAVLDATNGRFPGNSGPDLVVRAHSGESIQTAVDGAGDLNGDGYIILGVVARDNGLLGGHTSQNVAITANYPLPFGLIACSVTMHAANTNLPTGSIGSSADAPAPAGGPGNIFVMDLHAHDSKVAGWLVEGDQRYMRNVGNSADQHNQVGIHFIGHNNTMHNGAAVGNLGAGIVVEGSGNNLDSVDSFANAACGIEVAGNSNTVEKADVGTRGNGNGAGLCVTGNSNSLLENDAFANAGNGFAVNGNSNLLYKNRSGEAKSGNGQNGFLVVGAANNLNENKASANGGHGFVLAGGTAGAPILLKNNQSNTGKSGADTENLGAEYNLLGSVKNSGGGNKADNIALPSAGKCTSPFPNTNQTLTYAATMTCE